jgi:2-polyprenyl-3-methyl-5-hydroxy-6-metoxy-1,4-benzoquinol methylase
LRYASLDELRAQLGGGRSAEPTAAYAAKMLHPLPPFKGVADRNVFVLQHVKGKRVLEFGASGQLHVQVALLAAQYWGVDREARTVEVVRPGGSVSTFDVQGFDLDDVTVGALPTYPQADLILCGEVLEHLSNPGWFLARLKRQYAGVPVILTVPNAFTVVAQHWLKKGLENVNADHVAWYSPKTLSVLLERAGYTCADLFFYNGKDATAEGLIVVTE